MTAQKEIAQSLDIAARRAGNYGASSKQVWFLAGLSAKAGETHEFWSDYVAGEALTKATASRMISEYIN